MLVLSLNVAVRFFLRHGQLCPKARILEFYTGIYTSQDMENKLYVLEGSQCLQLEAYCGPMDDHRLWICKYLVEDPDCVKAMHRTFLEGRYLSEIFWQFFHCLEVSKYSVGICLYIRYAGKARVARFLLPLSRPKTT